MTLLSKTTAGLFLFAGVTFSYRTSEPQKAFPATITQTAKTRIQAAILLDVSGSMEGLIDQAKAQLWNMVSVMGKATCNNETPDIEIALYEYGRQTNDAGKGYVKKISDFTSDLDMLSQHLFALTTNGGDEYCGHVISSSLDELKWSTASTDYKVIFIAGNEDFLQGDISYTKACAKAKEKGVIVNTIYCGDKMHGLAEHWNLGGECGNGSYTCINANAKEEEIETPYDSLLFSLNSKLNNTYLSYGSYGAMGYANLQKADVANMKFRKSAGLKRVAVKGKQKLYSNANWDLLDAFEKDSTVLKKISINTLPDSLQVKTEKDLKEVIVRKSEERSGLQGEIEKINAQREAYIAEEKSKKKETSTDQTLETEIEKIIKEQAKRFNMQIQ